MGRNISEKILLQPRSEAKQLECLTTWMPALFPKFPTAEIVLYLKLPTKMVHTIFPYTTPIEILNTHITVKKKPSNI